MILDGHVHITEETVDRDGLRSRLATAGVDGAVLISLPPNSFRQDAVGPGWQARLDNLATWTESDARWYPFFWIDPLEDDALEQVTAAAERPVSGIKVICDRFYPRDDRAMAVFRAVAEAGTPILFHSGILWDGRDSARYNRPGEFEALLEVDRLRFCLAHLSWPWCDEMIAVYGKFLNAHTRRSELAVEMFVDNTPGTPEIYRREALTKLFGAGYDVGNNVIFGTDARADDYNGDWVRQWIDRDTAIYGDLGLSEAARERVFAGNLLRFIGASDAKVNRRLPRPAE